MKLLIKLFLITFLATAAMASSQKLLHITNDEDSSYYHLGVNVDDDTNEVESIYKKEFSTDGKLLLTESYSLAQFINGVVLVKRSGRDVVSIKASNLNPSDGADVTITTLYSGISGEKKVYSSSVERVGENWKFNFENRQATKLHFVTNKKFVIGVIGIKTIKASK